MIRVWLQRRPDGALVGFAVRGHSGLRRSGHDIVCAAVSVLTQTVAVGLERQVGVNVRVRAGDGELVCTLPDGLSPSELRRCQDLMETMCLGLREVALAYPRRLQLCEGAHDSSVGS